MSARGFIRRWNLRVLRREWRQHLVIFALMLIGITLSIGGVVGTYNLVEPPEGEYGNGQFAVWTDDDPATMAAVLEAGGHMFGTIESAILRVTGTSQRVDVRAIDPTNVVAAPLVALLEGRLPVDPTEVALTDRAVIDTQVGDTIRLAGQREQVVGIIENPTDLADEFALAASLERFGATDVATRFLVDADPAAVQYPGVRTVNTSSKGGPPLRTTATIAGTLISAVGMLEIGLLVGAGFAVISLRRMRQFGLLAAAGATPRQLRSAATGRGFLLGVFAAVCGAAIGISMAWLLVPRMEQAVEHRIAFAVPWRAVAANMMVAVGVASLAARWPARALSAKPVGHLLVARRPTAEPVGRPAVVGVLIAAVGVVALAIGFARLNLLLTALGVLLAPVGLLLMAPLLVRLLAQATERMPLALRLAGRSMGRHNRRSAAVVAALALGLAVPIGIMVVTSSIDARRVDHGPNLAEQWFVVWQPGAADGSTRLPAALDPDVLAETAARVADVAPELTLTPIQAAIVPDGPREVWDFDDIGSQESVGPILAGRSGSDQCLSCDVYEFDDGDGTESSWIVENTWIAEPDLLAVLGIDAEPDGASVVARSEDYRAISSFGPVGEDGSVAVADSWPRNSRVPPMLITPDAVEQGGFRPLTIAVLAAADGPITAETRDLIRGVVGPDLVLEFHEPPTEQSGLRAAALVIGMAFGVGVAVATVKLFTAELDADLHVLQSIGAPPRTIRRMAAAVAAIVAVAGTVLGLLLGYVALIPLITARDLDLPFVVPWPSLVALLVVFPCVAAVAGWFGGRPSRPTVPT